MQMLMEVAKYLSWLAIPVGLFCIADDWFLRPRRQIVAASGQNDRTLRAA